MKCLCGLQDINVKTTGNNFIHTCDKINLKSACVGGNNALGVFCIPVASAKTTKHLAALKFWLFVQTYNLK